ncbi:MAG: PKD domain-containing protein [Thermoplasmata archaeon]|nr:MAG: PKD domain-containing protein [Thermoplasmata archaeon]
MRKLVSVSIVGAMMLTLIFGLFGGVVEEGKCEIVYDISTNTIYVNSSDSFLASIDGSVPDSIFWHNPAENSYHTTANIQVNDSATLTINPTQKLKLYNASELLFLTVRGILIANGNNELNTISIDSNSTSPSAGDWGGIRFITEISASSILNFVYIANATQAIYCEKSNITISNAIITQNTDYGMYIKDSSPTLKKIQMLNNGNGDPLDCGVYFENSKSIFENCSVINSDFYDIILFGSSNITTMNSTFDDDKVLGIGSTYKFIVRWYLHVLVTEEGGINPIADANVYIKNSTGVPIQGSPFKTASDGNVRWIKVIEYIRDGSLTRISHTPHNITVMHDEYYTGYAKPSPQMTTSKKVQINLTMLRRDLTTTTSDISFSPPDIPIAGEELWIRAKIYNVEVDDAYDVRVLIVDNAPEGSQTIHNSSIGEIKGNSSKNAADVWNPTPGIHIIEVFIDPYDTIPEINDTAPPGWAENNNYASIEISVNALPFVNITNPENDTEVNRSLFIRGTANDDPRDDEMGSNITRVDIKLDEYDWVELQATSLNLTYNTLVGRWEWFYGWDTTQWNGTPIADGNYTIYARSWDNYHFSDIYSVDIAINNTGANTPPNAVISSPTEPNEFNVSQEITFDGTESTDDENPQNLNFSWDLDDTVDTNGDGNFTNDKEAFGNITIHAYHTIGVFTVTLNVTDPQGLSDFDNVTIWVTNHLPVVNITVSNVQPYEEDVVYFNGSESFDPDGNIVSYTWDFNDSTPTATGPEVNHTYTEPGPYNVTLTVMDNTNAHNTTWIIIEVLDNAQPNAQIDDPDPFDTFNVYEKIFFNGSDSSDFNDNELEYFWEFGDGNTYLENASNYPDGEYDGKTTYNYSYIPPLNTFTVTLTVRDDDGGEDSTLITIFVNNYPPVANATSNVTTAPTYQNVQFDASNSEDEDGDTLIYRWDFDDGGISSSETPVHQYTQDGVYNVTLNVTDGAAYDIDWIIITITNRAPIIEEITISPEFPKVYETIEIDITATDDDGDIVNYSWDFGDGESYYETEDYHPDDIFDGVTTHSYPIKMDYILIVTVVDDDGNITTTQFYINITNTPPEVSITSPQDGATKDGTILIEGTSFDIDDGEVSRVEIKIGNFDWIQTQDESGNDTFYKWEYNWDTEDGDYKVPNGTYTILARAYDEEGGVSEQDSISVYVDNQPTSIGVTMNVNRTTVEAGDAIDVWGKVTYNTGGPVTGIEVNITLVDDYWLAPVSSTGDYQISITAPDVEGNFLARVTAKKESYDDATESTLIYITAPPKKPDLTVSSSDIDFNPSAPVSGVTVEISIMIWNDGEANAVDVLVNIYDGDPDIQEKLISSEKIDIPKPDDEEEGSYEEITIYWPTTGELGDHDIYVVIDPDDDIDELDETNNEASKPINIQGQSDFTIKSSTDIAFSTESPKIGDTVTIQVTIYNEGPESGSVKYKIVDVNPETDERSTISEDTTDEIPGSEENTNYVTISVDWEPQEGGEHIIYVEVDPANQITETNEKNNNASRTIKVEAPPGEEGLPPWLIPLTVILIVIVILLIVYLNYKGKGSKPESELPVAEVVKTESKKSAKEVKDEEEEEPESLLDTGGGIRIG